MRTALVFDFVGFLMSTLPGPTQADTVYDSLRLDILSCRLRPGARIRINDVAQALDVSLGAVREALSRLAAEDMAVATAQKGYRVPPVSVDDLRNLTKARIAMEDLCLRDAIRNGDIEWETALAAAFHRLQRLPEREPSDTSRLNEAWSAAHQVFHAALVAGCSNPWLLKMRAILYAQTERYRRLSVPLRRVDRDVAAEHKGIFDAVMARDAPLAFRLMREHLTITADIVAGAALLQGTTSHAEAPAGRTRRQASPGRQVARGAEGVAASRVQSEDHKPEVRPVRPRKAR